MFNPLQVRERAIDFLGLGQEDFKNEHPGLVETENKHCCTQTGLQLL